MIDFTLAAQRPALLKGFDNEFHILAKLNAPEQPDDTRERKPLNLSIVMIVQVRCLATFRRG